MSTAYGIKAIMLLEGYLSPDLIPVTEQLKKMALPGGRYASRAQIAPRPEVTAVVVDTLHRIDGAASFDTQIASIENDLSDFERDRPFILTTILETSVRLQPDSKLTTSIIDDLLAARRPYGDLLLWPEKAEPV